MPELPQIPDVLAASGLGGQGITAVTLTAAQIASPTQVILQAVTTTYVLNVAPYTRYQSNGTSLVPIGSGGGSSSPTLIPFNTTLNLSGNYYSPDTQITAPTTLTVGAQAEGSSLAFNLIGDGTNDITVGAGIIARGDVFNKTAGRINNYIAGVNAGKVFLSNVDTGLTLPAVTSAVIASGTPTQITFTVNGAVTAAPAATDITLANAGGRTVTSVSFTGSTFTATVSSAFVNGVTPTYSIPAGKFSTAGGSNATITAASITNNVPAATLTDTFTRADSATTINPPSDGGVSWTILKGGPVGISANQGYAISGATDTLIVRDTGNVDNSQFIEFKTLVASNGDYVIPVFRCTDVNNHMQVVVHMANGGMSLNKVVAGVTTTVAAEVSGLFSYTAADLVKVKPVVAGSSVQIWVGLNGAAPTRIAGLDYTITDSILLTGTKVGFNWPALGNTVKLTQQG